MIDGTMEINYSLLKNTRLALSVIYKENISLDDCILIRVIHSYWITHCYRLIFFIT